MTSRFVVARSADDAAGLATKRPNASGTESLLWADAPDATGRHFLFISAPFGPFCHDLAAELRRSGARSTRVLLNAGDVLDWGMRHAIPYFGSWAAWGDWLRHTARRECVTDIVTYGDSSPYAALAVRVASELGLRTHVLEQGYFRPDWITLENSGVNANSSLPRQPSWYRSHSAAARADAASVVGRTTPAAIRHIVAYHLAVYLGAPLFPRYKGHYSDPAWKQALGHILRYGVQPFSRERDRRAYEDVFAMDGPVFLCALQRPGDSQLWRHSEFASPPTFINEVVASFATHAPTQARLIIRPHPLDPGLIPYRTIIARVARRMKVEDRIRFTDYGKLHEVLPRIAGVVCVNSTAGLAAIEFGKPTKALGRAIYNMEGLTHQGDLDGFWRAPSAPDASLYQAFRRVVMSEVQINGAYATEAGRAMAVPAIAWRLLSA
jgi:capsular polysaccharide export protein